MTRKRKIILGVTAVLLAFELDSQTYPQDYVENYSNLILFEEIRDEVTVYPGSFLGLSQSLCKPSFCGKLIL